MTLAVWAVGVWALFSWLPEWECTGYFVAAICTLFAALTAFTNACVGPRVPARVPQVMPLLSAAGCALAACAQVGLSMGELWRVGAHASRADMYEGLVGTWELVLRGLQVDLSFLAGPVSATLIVAWRSTRTPFTKPRDNALAEAVLLLGLLCLGGLCLLSDAGERFYAWTEPFSRDCVL
ncbi:MAG: hypothetical protein AAF645_18165 [Myxococcota bacterium]